MERTQKTQSETKENSEEYRIEEDPVGKMKAAMMGVPTDGILGALKALISDGESYSDDIPSDEWRVVYTAAMYYGLVRSVCESVDIMTNLRLNLEDYLDEEDQARFTLLNNRIKSDTREIRRLLGEYTDNVRLDLDVWREAEKTEEELTDEGGGDQ